MNHEWLDDFGELTSEAAALSHHFYRLINDPDGPDAVGWLEIEGVRSVEAGKLRRLVPQAAKAPGRRDYHWRLLFTVFLRDQIGTGYRDDGMYDLELDPMQYDLIRRGRIALPGSMSDIERLTEDEELAFAASINRDPDEPTGG